MGDVDTDLLPNRLQYETELFFLSILQSKAANNMQQNVRNLVRKVNYPNNKKFTNKKIDFMNLLALPLHSPYLVFAIIIIIIQYKKMTLLT